MDLNGCYNTASASVIVDPCQSVAEQQTDDVFKVYPNPSSGLVNFVFGTPASRNLSISNSVGQKVFECTLNSETGQIDLVHLAKGIYFISVDQNKNSTKYKLIID